MTTALNTTAPGGTGKADSAGVLDDCPSARVQVRSGGRWHTLCELGLLLPGRGVAGLLPDGRQVAVFRDRRGEVYAVDNRDPFTGAQVLSRGLLGSAGEVLFVASPLLKQRFDLRTGVCLDDKSVRVAVHPVRVEHPSRS